MNGRDIRSRRRDMASRFQCRLYRPNTRKERADALRRIALYLQITLRRLPANHIPDEAHWHLRRARDMRFESPDHSRNS